MFEPFLVERVVIYFSLGSPKCIRGNRGHGLFEEENRRTR